MMPGSGPESKWILGFIIHLTVLHTTRDTYVFKESDDENGEKICQEKQNILILEVNWKLVIRSGPKVSFPI